MSFKRTRQKLAVVAECLIRYRWLIAFCLFVVCVLCRIHMSSIGEYNKLFPTTSDGDFFYEIIGKSRGIRSDEWAVQTPTFFSQIYSNFSMTSYRQSLGGINMVLDYYAPVLDFTLIGKPFSWGYVLFGNEIGLSWYWSMYMILLFMLSFEMFWIITDHRKVLSAIGSLMVGFSPAIQWWMMPHMPVVFIYAMALFVVGYYFFTSENKVLSWLLTAAGVIGFVGFTLSIFPSVQIIMGIVALVLLICCLIRDRENITFHVKSIHCIQLILMICITGAIIGNFVLSYADDLKLLTGTAYPGKRVSLGGGNGIASLLPTLYTMFLPYKDANILNNCELATFIHFGPFFMLLFPKISRRMKEDHNRMILIGQALFVLLMIEIIFMCIGFTEIQAVLTLFSYNNRMQISYGFTATVFSVWGFYSLWQYPDLFSKKQKCLYIALFGLFYLTLIDANILQYCNVLFPVAEILILTAALAFVMMRRRYLSLMMFAAIMIEAGAFINPVCAGIGAVTNHPVSETISSVSRDDSNSLWMTFGSTSGVTGNFVAANGGRVLTGTNFYPDFAKWNILDPDGSDNEMYNRYTNQYAFLVEEETYFENPAADTINIYLNPEDLMKLNVTYILSNQEDLTEVLSKYGIRYEEIDSQDGYHVYHLSY